MSYWPVRMWQVGIASGASTSSYIDMGGKSYTQMAVNYVTMSTGMIVGVYGSPVTDGTIPFAQVNGLVTNTATVAYQKLQIVTAVSGSGWAVFNCPPFPYLQFVGTGVVSGGASFTIMAFD